jgi:pimeloyl-ACP methyl ester carboxylesterase
MSSILLAALIATSAVTPPDIPRFGEIELSTGIRMHYAEQGEARREPIILLHGYSDSWFSFSRVLTPLAREARVYALDLRGHGKTDKPATGYTMRDLAADVVAFMDAKGIVRATVIGHSMGGFVAQQVALAAPKRVSHLVLVGTARTGPDVTGFAELEQAVATLPDPVPDAFVREFQLSTVHVPVGDAFIDRAVAESLRLPSRVWRELAAGMRATSRAVALGRAGIPTLVLRGERDAYVSAAETDSLIAMVHASRFEVYPNTGHALHWEQPAAFARDVLAFRASRLSAARNPRCRATCSS